MNALFKIEPGGLWVVHRCLNDGNMLIAELEGCRPLVSHIWKSLDPSYQSRTSDVGTMYFKAVGSVGR